MSALSLTDPSRWNPEIIDGLHQSAVTLTCTWDILSFLHFYYSGSIHGTGIFCPLGAKHSTSPLSQKHTLIPISFTEALFVFGDFSEAGLRVLAKF